MSYRYHPGSKTIFTIKNPVPYSQKQLAVYREFLRTGRLTTLEYGWTPEVCASMYDYIMNIEVDAPVIIPSDAPDLKHWTEWEEE